MTPPPDWPWGDNWIDLDRLPDPWQSYFRKAEEFIHDVLRGNDFWPAYSQLSNIHWGMTGEVRLYSEARRSESGDRYFLAVDAGAPIQMYDTFCRLLSHRKVLSDIGAPPGTPYERQALVMYYPVRDPQGRHGVAIRRGSTKQAPMGDDVRVGCLTFLIHRSLQFMYLHELAHVVNGHVDYLAINKLVSPRERRGMEHRADIKAAFDALYFETLKGPTEEEVLSHAARLWGFAVAIWFLLVDAFQALESPSGPAPLRAYPSAALRAFVVLASFAGGPEGYGGRSRDDVQADVYRGFQEALDAWGVMGWGEYEYPEANQIDQALADYELLEGRLPKPRLGA